MKSTTKGRVIVLMSGGVDSSVAAALLKEQGDDIIGVYILGWVGTTEFPCNWQKEEGDARAVAEKLDIPFYTVNLATIYEREVIDRFFAGYQAGLTPNPDILCNKEIKFKAVWQAVRQFEPDYIASGHYASTQQSAVSSQQSAISNQQSAKYGKAESRKPKAERFGIFKPKDLNKDQTYFLWGIEKAMLAKIIFPLGELTKPEVRQLAKKYQLPTATKKDSQGICFVGPLKVRQFLASRINTIPGDVYLKDGRRIATHQGVELYTIGQRLAAGSVDWTGDVPPLFVIAKDIANNRLIVGSDAQTYGDSLVVGSINWLVDNKGQTFEGLAKIRYRQEDETVRITRIDSISDRRTRDTSEATKWSVKFLRMVRALTVGQSIVFYSAEGQLLGGGIIELVPRQDETIQQLAQALSQTKV